MRQKVLKSMVLFALILFFCKSSKGQFRCGVEVEQQFLLKDEKNRNELLYIQEKLRETILLNNRNTAVVYTIPVVVHVIHRGESEGSGTNISTAQIQGAISGLNDRFRNQIGNGLDLEVEFCLASRDPNGNATTGIRRINGNTVANYSTLGIEFPGVCSNGASETAIKNLSYWDRSKYYNIWVVAEICDGVGNWGGYAQFPFGSVVPALDGTVIVASGMTNSSPLLSHEVGHGFGLLHTHDGSGQYDPLTGCPLNVNCWTQGDFCCDTPPHKQADCASTNPCTSLGVWNNSRYNYMSYCNPSSTNARFTQDQKDRVRGFLNQAPRSSLLTSQGCLAPIANNECSGAINLNVCSGTTCCGATTGSLSGATQSISAISCNGFTSTMVQDVWFKFTATCNNHTITVIPSSGLDAVVDLRSGACNGTNIACSDNGNGAGGTEILTYSSFTTGNTYYIRIYDYTGASVPPTSTTFTICVTSNCSSCTTPTTQASNIGFSTVGSTSMTAGWTIGNGSRRVVYINSTNNFIPPTNGTDPIANTIYSGSSQQCIYNGTGSTVPVSNLTCNSTYYFRVYEANCTGSSSVYYTSSGTNNPNSQPTSPCSGLLQGVDISSHNGTVSWSQVSTTNHSFAYIKASEGVNSPSSVTAYFNSAITSNNPFNLTLGAYHLGRPDFSANNTALNEAQGFWTNAGSYTGNGFLPPALDMENVYINTYINQGHTYADLAMWINTWCQQVYNLTVPHRWPVLYISRSDAACLVQYYGGIINQNIKLWIATASIGLPSIPGNPPGFTACGHNWNTWPWVFHQYYVPQNAGNDPNYGVTPGMDQDVFFGTQADFNSLIGVPPTCISPTTQASNISFPIPGITASTLTASWTNGNGSRRVVYVNTTNTFTAPTNGTDPTPNTNYSGSGQQCIYNGTGNSVSVSNLLCNTTYYFRVYEANCSGNISVYNIASSTLNPNGQITLPCCSIPTTQASGINFSSIAATSMTANWTNGSGSRRIAYINTTNTFTSPSNGFDPAANPNYGGSGQQCIYNGTGSSVTVSGLSCNTTYFVRVYEANCTSASSVYNISTATLNPISQITTSLIPSVSISGNPSGPICSGQSVTFTAIPTNGGSTPSYQWQVNGVNFATGPTFTSSLLITGQVVTVMMTSSLACANPASVPSPPVTMQVNGSVTPSVSVIANPSGPICTGQSVTFTATPSNEGPNPTYQWQVNGSNVGTNSPTFTSSTLANNQVVTVMMTSSLACANPALVTSSGFTIIVSANIPSMPTINAASSITGTSFTANWSAVTGATNYLIDVSTTSNFSSILTNYNNLNVGSNTSFNVTNLACNTTYYYRVKAVNSCGQSSPAQSLPTQTMSCQAPVPPDYTLINSFLGLNFLTGGSTRDFFVAILNVNNVTSIVNPGLPLEFRIIKPPGFTISVSGTTTSTNGTPVQNSDWIIDNTNTFFVKLTFKNTSSIPANGQSLVGLTITRNNGVAPNTTANITSVIVNNSGGDNNTNNNTVNTQVVAL